MFSLKIKIDHKNFCEKGHWPQWPGLVDWSQVLLTTQIGQFLHWGQDWGGGVHQVVDDQHGQGVGGEAVGGLGVPRDPLQFGPVPDGVDQRLYPGVVKTKGLQQARVL